MSNRIYFDNNATTPIDPTVKQELISSLDTFGNASSLHEEGRVAKGLLNRSRSSIAEKLGVKSSEITFTSGGSESMNTLILGALKNNSEGHIISSTVEHACVLETLKMLEATGRYTVTHINPGTFGAVTPQQIKEALKHNTVLITLMAANNETGVVTPIESIAAIAQERRIPFVVDGVCALGKYPISLVEGITGMGFSAHKFHAPKGIGFFYLRSNVPFRPLILGGEQEQGRRGGTVAVSLAAAAAKAVELLSDKHIVKMNDLRALFETLLIQKIPQAAVNGEGPRICNTSNIAFEGIEGEILLQRLDLRGLACSHGSACSSGALEPSKVLLGMGYSKDRAGSSIRFSISRMTTEDEIHKAVEIISSEVQALA